MQDKHYIDLYPMLSYGSTEKSIIEDFSMTAAPNWGALQIPIKEGKGIEQNKKNTVSSC
jgi:hypothetical protein